MPTCTVVTVSPHNGATEGVHPAAEGDAESPRPSTSTRRRLVAATGVVAAVVLAVVIVVSRDNDVESRSNHAATDMSHIPGTTHEAHGGTTGSALDPIGTEDHRQLYRYGDGTMLISRWPLDATPTDQQRADADLLTAETIEGIARFRDVAAAEADGYAQLDDVHWLKLDLMTDERTLDPLAPEGLMYADDPASGQKVLVAALFIAPAGVHGPQFGGPETVWHFHDYPGGTCLQEGVVPIAPPSADGTCARGTLGTRSPEMIHVWISNEHGRFDHDMSASQATIDATKATSR